MDPVEAARAVVESRFPDCLAAFAGGSIMRGEGTPTSDIDLVIVTTDEAAPYRDSFVECGWPIEAFVHTAESYRRYFASDAEERTPMLPTMCVEGAIIRDVDGWAQRVREEARELIARGPQPLTEADIARHRYFITDLLDDLEGSRNADESLLIAHELATHAADFVLAYNRRWSGRAKSLLRALRKYDPALAEQLAGALRTFYQSGEREKLVRFVEQALEPAGGRLFAGYRVAGRREG